MVREANIFSQYEHFQLKYSIKLNIHLIFSIKFSPLIFSVPRPLIAEYLHDTLTRWFVSMGASDSLFSLSLSLFGCHFVRLFNSVDPNQ